MSRLMMCQLALATAVLATPAFAQDTPAEPVVAQKTVQWLITPPDTVPQTFAEQTKVVAAWEAAAKTKTTAYGVDRLLKQSAEVK